jgi:hypothetical protein
MNKTTISEIIIRNKKVALKKLLPVKIEKWGKLFILFEPIFGEYSVGLTLKKAIRNLKENMGFVYLMYSHPDNKHFTPEAIKLSNRLKRIIR